MASKITSAAVTRRGVTAMMPSKPSTTPKPEGQSYKATAVYVAAGETPPVAKVWDAPSIIQRIPISPAVVSGQSQDGMTWKFNEWGKVTVENAEYPEGSGNKLYCTTNVLARRVDLSKEQRETARTKRDTKMFAVYGKRLGARIEGLEETE